MEADVRLMVKLHGESGVQLVEVTKGQLFNLKFSNNNRFVELGDTFFNKDQILWFKED